MRNRRTVLLRSTHIVRLNTQNYMLLLLLLNAPIGRDVSNLVRKYSIRIYVDDISPDNRSIFVSRSRVNTFPFSFPSIEYLFRNTLNVKWYFLQYIFPGFDVETTFGLFRYFRTLVRRCTRAASKKWTEFSLKHSFHYWVVNVFGPRLYRDDANDPAEVKSRPL